MTDPVNGYPHEPPAVFPQIPVQPEAALQPVVPQQPAEDVPWARQSTGGTHTTARSRQRVRTLPPWDPAPPGEVVVRRHRRD